ncbi:MAG: glycosyltransferase 87 family protein, partial [Terracidiphilus sp.]
MEKITAQENKPQVNVRFRAVVKVLIALAIAAAVLAVYVVGFKDDSAAQCDFISYWAAGQLLARGQNPYDAKAVRALELKEGLDPSALTLVMRNPPLALPLAWPFGRIGSKSGVIAWTFLLIAALILISRLLWVMNGRQDSLLNLLGFGFPPVVACLMARQTGILLLLGITLFLFFRKDHLFLAGASLWLCAIKPHYFVPFGMALFLWCLTNKKGYRILAGFSGVLAVSCALAYAMDPHAWAQYAELIRTGGPLNEIVPSWSAQLRLVTNPHDVWIQFLLEAGA